MVRIALSVVAFVAFTAYSIAVAAEHSLIGFLAGLSDGGWTLQVTLDLVVAAISFWIVAIPDARRRGLIVWPYVALTPFVGSIALLAYFVHRSLREPKTATATSGAAT